VETAKKDPASSNQQGNRFLEIFFITRLVMEIVETAALRPGQYSPTFQPAP
jgi:hypothetical protein